MTYTWQVVNFITRNEQSSDGVTLENAVVNIHWKRFGVDADGNTASINGYTPLTAEQTASADFVNFNDLTEEIVTNWLDNENAGQIGEYNAKIVAKIAKSGETTRAVPWS